MNLSLWKTQPATAIALGKVQLEKMTVMPWAFVPEKKLRAQEGKSYDVGVFSVDNKTLLELQKWRFCKGEVGDWPVDGSIGVEVVEPVCCFRSKCTVRVCSSWLLGEGESVWISKPRNWQSECNCACLLSHSLWVVGLQFLSRCLIKLFMIGILFSVGLSQFNRSCHRNIVSCGSSQWKSTR